MRPPIVEPGINTKRMDFHLELWAALEDMLGRHIANHGPIVRAERRVVCRSDQL